MKDTMADYEIVSITETPLMDVYPADLTIKKPADNASQQVSPL